MSNIFGMQRISPASSIALNRPAHSTSVPMFRLSLPSKSDSEKKGLKPKELFKKAEQKGKESSAFGPSGQLSYNLMDLHNHQALKTGPSQKAKVGAGPWVQPNPFGSLKIAGYQKDRLFCSPTSLRAPGVWLPVPLI